VTVPRSGTLYKIRVVARLAVMAAVGGALVAALALPAISTVGVVFRNAARKFNSLPTPELGQLPVRSEILDRHGHLLAYYYQRSIDRVPVSYSQIAPVMRQAIIAIEDSRFYQHGAMDFKGTIRAIVNNLQHRPTQGGSTLAQQYVKNVEILSAANPQAAFQHATADTIGRKIRELRMAARVEHLMTKNQILTGYLNAAYFGGVAYGIQVAAQQYFGTTAAKLSLTQAADLAGIVENPAAYDPVNHPVASRTRRNLVLGRMAQLHMITPAQAAAAEKRPLRLHATVPQSGCTSPSARFAGYLCDYALQVLKHDRAYRKVWAALNGKGGLKIYTTLDPKQQRSANHAVNYVLPHPPSGINPGKNADTEVLIQPGTGQIRAIGIDRPYGYGPHHNTLNYAVGPQYNGGEGVQIGSTGKVYVMVTALEQGLPFGYAKTVPFQADVSGYTNCKGQPTGQVLPNGQLGWQVHNDESEKGGHYTLYTGTTYSINVFFAYLEQKVGLCNVVHTAARMGLTRPDGRSLLRRDHGRTSADNVPAFTLGAVNVTPMSVAAADATLPARGVYCSPIAILRIERANGSKLPVESAHCHRALTKRIADAANYILQGDLTGLGTAGADAIPRPAAAKTGTADLYRSAFFVGYTPQLLGAVWVGNPRDPVKYPMQGYPGSCFHSPFSGFTCPGFMYGSMAPGQTWNLTFLQALRGWPALSFVPLSPSDTLFSAGNGQVLPTPPAHHTGGGGHHHGGGGHHHGGGGGGGGGHGGGGGGH
jgi:membrane peptidoglycan carboxypeptidase